jgi:hypothetical protein
MKNKLSIVLMVAASIMSGNAFAGGADIDRDPIVALGSVDAQLIRNNNGVSVHGTLYNAVAGHTYTVWWIIDGAEFIVLNATGGIANGKDELRFAAGLPTGTYVEGEGSREVFLFPGTFADPRDAVIVLDFVSHGPAVPGRIPEQISSLYDCAAFGGESDCEGDNEDPTARIVFIP